MVNHIKKLAQQETPSMRRQRMIPGALYGLLIAVSFVLAGNFVNALSFRTLPVGIDWGALLRSGFLFSLWLGLGGGFINWFTQNEESITPGFLMLVITALMAGWVSFEGSLPTQVGKLFLLALPLIGISFLITVILRRLGVRHAELLEQERTTRRRGIFSMILITILIGGLTGLLSMRWSDDLLSGVEDIHNRLQTASVSPSQTEALFPLNDIPGLKDHLDTPYTLRGKPSPESVVAFNVNVDFRDGYQFTCVLLVFPDKPPFLRACAEGEDASLPVE